MPVFCIRNGRNRPGNAIAITVEARRFCEATRTCGRSTRGPLKAALVSLKLVQSDTESPPATEAATAESLGRQLRAMLPPLRLHSMSVYNGEGDVLWLSEGALGPDEHNVVLEAIQTLHGEMRKSYHEITLEDGRFAMFLPVRAPRGDLVGIVMLLTESRMLPEGTKELLAGSRIRGMLQRIAVFLRVGTTRSGETTPAPAFPAIPQATETLSSTKVDEILTLELEGDPDATQIAPAHGRPAPQPTLTLSQDADADATQIAPAHVRLPPRRKPGPAASGRKPDSPEAIPASAKPTGAAETGAVADAAADLALSVQELVKMRSSGRTRRYEVLARSRSDSGRNEVPAAFVAKSASGRDGATLDGEVIHQLVDWLSRHPQIWDGEPASFSVNLSIGAIEDPRFLEGAAAAIRAAGIPANSLGFEITEFACVQCKAQVQRFVAACEQMGCFVVLDNFTFDSAAVALLGSSAMRMVKIDPKLTTAAMKEKLPQAVVIAISQACKVLGVHCIAKNVETPAALEWLEAIGCDFAQGFALEKPLSLESLAGPAPTLPRARGKEGRGKEEKGRR